MAMCIRITPARAGKTKRHLLIRQLDGDHPRSCGKDRSRRFRMELRSGSPPLVRERQWQRGQSMTTFGITPARAGKT